MGSSPTARTTRKTPSTLSYLLAGEPALGETGLGRSRSDHILTTFDRGQFPIRKDSVVQCVTRRRLRRVATGFIEASAAGSKSIVWERAPNTGSRVGGSASFRRSAVRVCAIYLRPLDERQFPTAAVRATMWLEQNDVARFVPSGLYLSKEQIRCFPEKSKNRLQPS